MLFKFRKIAILALCLVLVCGLSIAVSADDSFYVRDDYFEDYSEGIHYAEAYANITRYETYGGTIVTSSYSSGVAYVGMTFRYLDADLNQVSDDLSQTRSGSAEIRLSDSTMFAMVEADYDFRAEVPTEYGQQTFRVGTINLQY